MAHKAGTVQDYLVKQGAQDALARIRSAGFDDECSYIEEWIRLLENGWRAMTEGYDGHT